ncbi:hypothetical protein [Candidatus Mycoplasma haematohominis]|uniref:hypothetical protein n=1 Tax=Candidatus Mycoplasma haematohominis TaxID=1494318 RepID=UPI001C0A6BB2|nr:hypothetical protein [Candidatus Mycoplasma haemohominis]
MFNSFRGTLSLVAGSAIFIWVCVSIYSLKSRDVTLNIRHNYRRRSGIGKRSTVRKFIQNSDPGTFGSDFKNHFVDATDAANNGWWDWNYSNRFLKNLESGEGYRKTSAVFLKVRSAQDLKDKCRDVYKKNTRKYISPISRNLEQHKYERDVWIYCSEEGQVPVTVQESKDVFQGRSRLSNVYSSRMISTSSPENRRFWSRHAASFYGEKDKLNGSGQDAKSDEAGFKKLFHSETKTLDSLRALCEKNYNHLYNDVITDIAKETLRFCSLAGSSE